MEVLEGVPRRLFALFVQRFLFTRSGHVGSLNLCLACLRLTQKFG